MTSKPKPKPKPEPQPTPVPTNPLPNPEPAVAETKVKAGWRAAFTPAILLQLFAAVGISWTTLAGGLWAWGKSTTVAWAEERTDQIISGSPSIQAIRKNLETLAIEQAQVQDESAATKSDVTIIKEQNKIIIELTKELLKKQ